MWYSFTCDVFKGVSQRINQKWILIHDGVTNNIHMYLAQR